MKGLFEQIVAHGNRSFASDRQAESLGNKVKCADGFELSVIAGEGAYCAPRPDRFGALGDVPGDYPGPYFAVEVGYPTERPEPWHCSAWNEGHDSHDDHPTCDGWESYCEDAEKPTDTVYGWVPVEMVRALIDSHGGEA